MRFAGAVALSRSAKRAKEDVKTEIRRVFNNPTPFTVNSVYAKTANKNDLSAKVGLKDWTPKGRGAGRYLQPHIVGGQREDKRSEYLLRQRGLLPSGYQIVPTDYAPLNRYGNVTKGYMNKILSGLGAQHDAYQNRNKRSTRSRKKEQYFMAKIDGTLAIWRRIGRKNRGIMPIFIIVRKPRYKVRFKYKEVADNAFFKYFQDEYDRAIEYALKTAK